LADEWFQIFEGEHSTAIICDCFWYVICKIFNSGNYTEHEECLLDRISANYVSFMLTLPVKQKDRFFKGFYDVIAQSTFYSLFYAFPKSRKVFDNNLKRTLLDIFSELFSGMIVKSAQFNHWGLDLGAGNVFPEKKLFAKKDITLADIEPSKKFTIKAKREIVPMKFSPLVERYLKAKRYETRNQLRPWRMVMTQRKNQAETDEKFKNYSRIAEDAVKLKKKLIKDYDALSKRIKKEMQDNEAACMKHILRLKKDEQQKLQNQASEYANYLVSMFNKEYNM